MPDPTRKHPPLKLTKGYIDKVTPGPADELHWDTDVKGFGLRVTPTRKLTFIVQGRVGGVGTAARITIGPYGVFTVDQAREVAREHLRSMRMGVDPREVKKQQEAERQQKVTEGVTLKQVYDSYVTCARVTSSRRHSFEGCSDDRERVPAVGLGDRRPVLRRRPVHGLATVSAPRRCCVSTGETRIARHVTRRSGTARLRRGESAIPMR